MRVLRFVDWTAVPVLGFSLPGDFSMICVYETPCETVCRVRRESKDKGRYASLEAIGGSNLARIADQIAICNKSHINLCQVLYHNDYNLMDTLRIHLLDPMRQYIHTHANSRLCGANSIPSYCISPLH